MHCLFSLAVWRYHIFDSAPSHWIYDAVRFEPVGVTTHDLFLAALLQRGVQSPDLLFGRVSAQRLACPWVGSLCALHLMWLEYRPYLRVAPQAFRTPGRGVDGCIGREAG